MRYSISIEKVKLYPLFHISNRHKKAIFYAKNAIMKTESAIHKVKTMALQK